MNIDKTKINLFLTLFAYIGVFLAIFSLGILFQKHILNPKLPEENKRYNIEEIVVGFSPTQELMLFNNKSNTLSIYPKEVCDFIYLQYSAINYYKDKK